MQAHIIAIAAPQTAEDNRRYDGYYPESNEGVRFRSGIAISLEVVIMIEQVHADNSEFSGRSFELSSTL